MKVIFLDIDGVLNSTPYLDSIDHILIEQKEAYSKERFDPIAVERLNRLVDSTGAKIVLSSSWRHYGVEKVQELMKQRGFRGTLFDRTPKSTEMAGMKLSIAMFSMTDRGHNIRAWIQGNRFCGDNTPVSRFVILDDRNDMCELGKYLIQTPELIGLIDEHVDRATQLLNSDRDPSLELCSRCGIEIGRHRSPVEPGEWGRSAPCSIR